MFQKKNCFGIKIRGAYFNGKSNIVTESEHFIQQFWRQEINCKIYVATEDRNIIVNQVLSTSFYENTELSTATLCTSGLRNTA